MFHRFVSNKIKVTFQSNNILWVHQYLWVEWKSKCKNAFMFIANGYIIQYVFNILHINDFFIRESTQQRNLRKLAFTDYWWNHDVLSILINIENVNKLFDDFFHRKFSVNFPNLHGFLSESDPGCEVKGDASCRQWIWGPPWDWGHRSLEIL